MSKHNYSQYSNNKNNNADTENITNYVNTNIDNSIDADEVTTVPATTVDLVEETVETVTLPEIVTGTVAGCTKLNVRAKADVTADVVCVLDAKSEIKIDVAKSTDEWFSICTATGIEGYCMRKFVEASL